MTTLDGLKVLVVDDDRGLLRMLAVILTDAGADPFTAANGEQALTLFAEKDPDVVVLDILMPDINGWEVCRRIRELSATPIIMLSSLQEDDEVIRALDAGADDFVIKPFSPKVLLARIRAAVRRTLPGKSPDDANAYQDGYLDIDLSRRQILVAGEALKLTDTEFRLLAYLLENANRILTYQQILDHVWGWEYRGSVEYVHVYLSHLRRKLGDDSREPTYLQTEYGVGYRFARQDFD